MVKRYDIIIIGAGPAGIFTALEAVRRAPGTRVLLVDNGREIESRRCPARATGRCGGCQPCAIVSGWAGAGAFSDGKLSLSCAVGGNLDQYMPAPRAQALIQYADGIYMEFGAPGEVYGLNTQAVDDIAYNAARHNIRLIPCPVRHLGTERAGEVLSAMYRWLVAEGRIDFQPLVHVRDILVRDGRAAGVVCVPQDGEPFEAEAAAVVAAPGRGGAQWLTGVCAALGITSENNAVDIGVRVEVPNATLDHLTRHLYEAKLVYYSDTFENKVRTFCMNPGGLVSEEHYEGGVAVVNGHSYLDAARKTGNTNFALLVSTSFTQPFNEPIQYGMHIARLANMLTGGKVMVQRLGDLDLGRRTNEDRLAKSTTLPTLATAVPGDLSFVLPQRHLTSIIESLRAFDKLAPGLYSKNTLLYGIEVKFYSSKIPVNGRFMTAIPGLYAIGDGAGITRGLMQASVTGVVVARDILGEGE